MNGPCRVCERMGAPPVSDPCGCPVVTANLPTADQVSYHLREWSWVRQNANQSVDPWALEAEYPDLYFWARLRYEHLWATDGPTMALIDQIRYISPLTPAPTENLCWEADVLRGDPPGIPPWMWLAALLALGLAAFILRR